MTKQLTILCLHAKKVLQEYGIEIVGLHYFLAAPHERYQKQCKGIGICFDAETHNPHFFGEKYENWRRIKLIDLAYQFLYDEAIKAFPEHEIYFDIMIHLVRPYRIDEPAFQSLKLDPDAVDVTQNNDVYFVELEQLLRDGEIEPGCTLDMYCKRYGLKHVLKHGWHCIAPDVGSVEVFEAAADSLSISSALEIGGGVGTLAAAAQRRAMKDFSFVDLSPTVCAYLRARFPYPVLHGSGLDFSFNRRWNFISMGMPYELNPWFLEKKGSELAACCDLVVFLSGDMGFFEFEHNWIAGSDELENWPWWNDEQTLPFHFPITFALRIQWQIVLVGMHNFELAKTLLRQMRNRGFTPISYQKIRLP